MTIQISHKHDDQQGGMRIAEHAQQDREALTYPRTAGGSLRKLRQRGRELFVVHRERRPTPDLSAPTRTLTDRLRVAGTPLWNQKLLRERERPQLMAFFRSTEAIDRDDLYP